MRRLLVPTLGFGAAQILHTLDHVLRQDRSLPTEINVVGLAGLAGTAILLILVLSGHRLAPLGAAIVGLGNAAGFAAVHLAPHWSAFSDPYPDLGLDAVSWASLALAIAAALWLGSAGLRAMRVHGQRLTSPVASAR